MNTRIRLHSKYLLSKNICRLFFISFASACLRWGRLIFTVAGIFIFLNSPLYEALRAKYGTAEVAFVSVLIYLWLFFLIALVSSGIKLGEQFLYFTRAQGSKGSLKLIFKYTAPKKAFRALRFYTTVNFYKFMWLLYFLLPCALCVGCDIYVYNYFSYPPIIHMILAVSISLLFSVCFVMWRISSARYSAAAYYFCLDPSMKVGDAIKKSIRFTDGFLAESVLLEYSLAGWILSCVFAAPIIYVVPYVKLCKCVFVTEMLLEKANPQPRFSGVTFLSGQHID